MFYVFLNIYGDGSFCELDIIDSEFSKLTNFVMYVGGTTTRIIGTTFKEIFQDSYCMFFIYFNLGSDFDIQVKNTTVTYKIFFYELLI